MSTRGSLSDDELREYWHIVDRSAATLRRRLDDELQQRTGLPASWVGALQVLAEADGQRLSINEAAALTGFTSGGYTKLADRLEGAGLLVREHSTDDRRMVHVILTELGAQAVRHAASTEASHLRQAFAPLAPEDVRALADAMRAMNAAEAEADADADIEADAAAS